LQPNIFDPRYWDGVDQKQIDILIQKGPKRDLSVQKGPKDGLSRGFLQLCTLELYQIEKLVIENG
jgi:hypothetical protein